MISDDDLLLYYYADGLEAGKRNEITAALTDQPELAARFEQLRLALAVSAGEVPVPAAALRRWRTDLDRAAREERVASVAVPAFRWKSAFAALAVLLVVSAVSFNRYWPGDGPADIGATSTANGDAVRYQRNLQWHLAQTELQLVGLNTLDPEQRLHLIDKVIAQNRVFAIAADRAREQNLARVLRSFDAQLEELAAQDNDSRQREGELSQLQFELKVMQARLAAQAPAFPHPTAPILAL